MLRAFDDGIVVVMNRPDRSTMPPRGMTDDELKTRIDEYLAEMRSKPGYKPPTKKELDRQMKAMADEARQRRGYALTPEQLEWQCYWLIVLGRAERGLKELGNDVPSTALYRYETPLVPMLREKRSHDAQPNRIDRDLSRTRIELEALGAKVQVFSEGSTTVTSQVEALTTRLDTLELAVNRIDLRVRRLERLAGLTDTR